MAAPVQYMARTRDYYFAQGYAKAYAWAHNESIPFVKPRKPLQQARVALITTAMPLKENQLPKQVESGRSATPPEKLFTDDLAWDKEATHTDDLDSYLPLSHLREAAAAGQIGSVAERYHCVPTEYSQRRTIDQDAPEILRRCAQDEVDVALLVPL